MKRPNQATVPQYSYQKAPRPTYIYLQSKWIMENDRITIGVGFFFFIGTTIGVGYLLQLQDGSIDLTLQGYHKIILSLHTELKSLV